MFVFENILVLDAAATFLHTYHFTIVFKISIPNRTLLGRFHLGCITDRNTFLCFISFWFKETKQHDSTQHSKYEDWNSDANSNSNNNIFTVRNLRKLDSFIFSYWRRSEAFFVFIPGILVPAILLVVLGLIFV